MTERKTLVTKGKTLAPLSYRPKRFHLGTEGDHHVFLGLLALLPLLGCLASFPCLAPLPYRPKRFHLGTEGDHHAFLGLLAFLPLL